MSDQNLAEFIAAIVLVGQPSGLLLPVGNVGDNIVSQFEETSICETMEVCNWAKCTSVPLSTLTKILSSVTAATLLLCCFALECLIVHPEQKNAAFPSQEDVNNSNPKIDTVGRHFISGKSYFNWLLGFQKMKFPCEENATNWCKLGTGAGFITENEKNEK